MKIIRHLLIMLLLSTMFCACTKKEDYSMYLSGRTFYNTVDEFDNYEHSKIWFGKDGTFVLTDNFFDGTYEMTGKWNVREDVCVLIVSQSGVGQFKEVVFEIVDEDTLILKTTLAGSKADDTFSTEEIKGSINSNNNVVIETYYCCSNVPNNQSYLELHSDGSAVFVDKNSFGISEGTCKYVTDGDYIELKDFTPYNPFNNNIVFKKESDDVFILQNDVSISVTGDVFAKQGRCPLVEATEIYENNYHNTIWIHQPIDYIATEYLPTVQFMNVQGKGYCFTFTENNYAGMSQILGSYSADERYIVCKVEDNSQMTGFTGQDVMYIEFEIVDGHTLRLLTDINMSRAGDLFILE